MTPQFLIKYRYQVFKLLVYLATKSYKVRMITETGQNLYQQFPSDVIKLLPLNTTKNYTLITLSVKY